MTGADSPSSRREARGRGTRQAHHTRDPPADRTSPRPSATPGMPSRTHRRVRGHTPPHLVVDHPTTTGDRRPGVTTPGMPTSIEPDRIGRHRLAHHTSRGLDGNTPTRRLDQWRWPRGTSGPAPLPVVTTGRASSGTDRTAAVERRPSGISPPLGECSVARDGPGATALRSVTAARSVPACVGESPVESLPGHPRDFQRTRPDHASARPARVTPGHAAEIRSPAPPVPTPGPPAHKQRRNGVLRPARAGPGRG